MTVMPMIVDTPKIKTIILYVVRKVLLKIHIKLYDTIKR